MNSKDLVINVAEITAKTLVSVMPVGGALLTSVYDVLKDNALAERREQWILCIEERLQNIENSIESLGKNHLFATAIVRGTELAMRTGTLEKINLIANSVMNSLSPDISEEKLIIFYALLDKYTVSHVKIANFFRDPKSFIDSTKNNYYMGSPTTVLFDAFPELNNSLFDKLIKDLYDDGIITLSSINITMSASGMIAKRTTKLGDEFLDFILT